MAKKIIWKIAFFIPFVLGTIGFLIAEESFLDSAFNSVLMYVFCYADSAPNVLVEVSRWLAPVATASGVVSLVVSFSIFWRNWFRNRVKDSVAVYGDEADAEYIKNQLGSKLISPVEDELVKAKKYILFKSEDENLEFYSAHRDQLMNRPVCIRLTSIASQELAGDMLKPFNAEETAARLFWKQLGMYEMAKSLSFNMSIAIIGFGKLGQEILLKGLQNNIFSPEQKLEYHVFGDGDAFGKLYHCLDEINDQVNFYDDWMDHVSVLGDADLIIAADPANEMELVRNLVFAVPEKKIYVVSELPEVMGLFDLKDRLVIFDWKNETLKPELMFEDGLMATAKRINLKYAHLYSGVAETAENAEKEWKTLNSFTKYSNVSSADYHEIRLMMLKDWNIPASGEGLSAEQLEMLSELEHIRWSRYHYLSNWTYGVPKDGKAKDPEKRIHTCLVPYEELPEEEKKKDRDNILVMLGVEV